MRRRSLLALLAAGVTPAASGCFSADDDVSLENFSEHDELGISFEGEVVQQPSEEEPLRIELRFTNEGSERSFGFAVTPPGLFSPVDASILVMPDDREAISPWDPDGPDGFVPDSSDGDCWRALNTFARPIDTRRWVLDSGEQSTERYTVLATPDAEACFPAGTHRFESMLYMDDEVQPLSFDLVLS